MSNVFAFVPPEDLLHQIADDLPAIHWANQDAAIFAFINVHCR